MLFLMLPVGRTIKTLTLSGPCLLVGARCCKAKNPGLVSTNRALMFQENWIDSRLV